MCLIIYVLNSFIHMGKGFYTFFPQASALNLFVRLFFQIVSSFFSLTVYDVSSHCQALLCDRTIQSYSALIFLTLVFIFVRTSDKMDLFIFFLIYHHFFSFYYFSLIFITCNKDCETGQTMQFFIYVE